MTGSAKRRPAKRPPTRTVHVLLAKGAFEGWEATAKADFPARMLGDLQSGNVERLIAVLDAIILEHNFPTSADELAEKMGDVDPQDGLMTIAGDLLTAIGKLPNR